MRGDLMITMGAFTLGIGQGFYEGAVKVRIFLEPFVPSYNTLGLQ